VKGTDICDGFGNSWTRCKLGADCGLKVINAGKARCWCQDQEASRAEVQVAREQIRCLDADNDRLRKALEDVMTESDEQVIWRMARAALERKEPQP